MKRKGPTLKQGSTIMTIFSQRNVTRIINIPNWMHIDILNVACVVQDAGLGPISY